MQLNFVHVDKYFLYFLAAQLQKVIPRNIVVCLKGYCVRKCDVSAT